MITTLIVLACLVLFVVVIGGVVFLILASKQGDGVSNARREWIEGVEDSDDM